MDLSSPPLQALCLGILQGLTEFLPISSSAHLILAPRFFDWQNSLLDSLVFDVALHAGTLLALLGYFWRDWLDLVGGFFRMVRRGRASDVRERLILFIVLGTIPAAVAGFFLEKTVETTFRSAGLIVIPLVAVSLLMIYAEARAAASKQIVHLSLKDALVVGTAQALALLPGVSRSGVTITTGLLRGFKRDAATRFSFLLSTPVIAGAAVLHLRHVFSVNEADWSLFAIGFSSSALVGYLAIAFLLRYLRAHTLNIFAAYRLILAAAILVWLLWKG